MALAFPTPDHSKSLLRGIDARWRSISFLLAMFLVAFYQNTTTLAACCIYSLLLLAITWRDYPWYVPRLAWITCGILLFVIPGLFLIRGEPIWDLGWLTISKESLHTTSVIFLRGLAISALALAWVGSTSFYEMAAGARQLGLGRSITSIFWMGCEQIETVQKEFKRMRVALKARGQTTSASALSWSSTARLCANLLVRSLDKTERLHHAILSRGFQGDFPMQSQPITTWREILLLLATSGIVSLGILLEQAGWL